MKSGTIRDYSPADIRKILLELRYFYTVKQLCAKWHITPYRLRQWQQALRGTPPIADRRELVIVAVHQGARTCADMIAYLDYVDHAVYTPDEINAVLDQLEAEGIALSHNGEWRYNQLHSVNDTAYIF